MSLLLGSTEQTSNRWAQHKPNALKTDQVISNLWDHSLSSPAAPCYGVYMLSLDRRGQTNPQHHASIFAATSTCVHGCVQRDSWPGTLGAGLYLLFASFSHARIVMWFSVASERPENSWNVWQRSDLSGHQNANVFPGQNIFFPPSASTQIPTFFHDEGILNGFSMPEGVFHCNYG